MAELEELEQEALEDKLLDVGPAVDSLPSVPTIQPAVPAKGQIVQYDN